MSGHDWVAIAAATKPAAVAALMDAWAEAVNLSDLQHRPFYIRNARQRDLTQHRQYKQWLKLLARLRWAGAQERSYFAWFIQRWKQRRERDSKLEAVPYVSRLVAPDNIAAFKKAAAVWLPQMEHYYADIRVGRELLDELSFNDTRENTVAQFWFALPAVFLAVCPEFARLQSSGRLIGDLAPEHCALVHHLRQQFVQHPTLLRDLKEAYGQICAA